jgi:hypothetical protein
MPGLSPSSPWLIMVPTYDDQVFINCPFDDGFKPIFDALVFTVHDCGFVARSALEVDDGADVRIDKIVRIIEQCRYGIHDLSRTELDVGSGLPRFNMPFELGLFLGAKRFGNRNQKAKSCLILEREPYLSHKCCSDIAGQDLRPHGGDPARAIAAVRNALASARQGTARIPGHARMNQRFQQFTTDLPAACAGLHLDPTDLSFFDYATLVSEWQAVNP